MGKAQKTFSAEELITMELLSEKLGKGYSRSSILKRIDITEEWKEGQHWVDVAPSGSKYRKIKLVLPAILKEVSTPIAMR